MVCSWSPPPTLVLARNGVVSQYWAIFLVFTGTISRMLKTSVASRIEAPLRFYVTANPDKTRHLLTGLNEVFDVYGSAALNKKAAKSIQFGQRSSLRR